MCIKLEATLPTGKRSELVEVGPTVISKAIVQHEVLLNETSFIASGRIADYGLFICGVQIRFGRLINSPFPATP